MNEKLDLPAEFLNNLELDFGKDILNKYLQEFSKSSVRGLRVNNLKIEPSKIEKIFGSSLEKINYCNNAYYLNTDAKLGNSILHQAGAYYLQEPSSMIPASSISGRDFNNKNILDLCASPGGKSTQIACLMNNSGLLVSNEIDSKRADILFSNIERLGISNCVVLNESPENLAKNLSNFFDYIFVDAPCSGEGMFRKDSTAIKEWNSSLKKFNHARQLDILSSANKMLKTNGLLVYSTCTFNRVENEGTVAKFCNQFNYKIVEVNESINPYTLNGICNTKFDNLNLTKHFFPFTAKGEGQFVAVLQKCESQQYKTVKNQKIIIQIKENCKEFKIIDKFFKDNLDLNKFDISKYNLLKIGGRVHIISNKVDYNLFENLKIKCLGVIVGEILKDRLVVHHQFFKAFEQMFKNQINLNFDSIFLKKYVKGEQLSLAQLTSSKDVINLNITQNGYGVILASNVCLGGVKIVDDMIKNHYPKALRLNNII